MLNRTNMSTIITDCIEKFLDMGITDKNEIYSKVIDELGVPRPTVRRVGRDMRNEMVRKVRILQTEIVFQKNV